MIEYFSFHTSTRSKNLVVEIKNKTQSEIAAELLDPEMLGALLNSVNSSFKTKKQEESQL